ncbi:MAG: PDZ domain-containing protein [Nocardioidaceae bacterium]|nr:PDZ domain-containing protein [Nocardioidaceae bacterium]MCL2612655.1 PDZ domain-containing protein [Nocardioidaceae bacterium]
MHQRLIAACVAAPLVLILAVLALAVPLPFASYSPGPTFDILGRDPSGAEVVQVAGHRAYYQDNQGEIRFTTVISSGDGEKLSLAEGLARWFDDHDAVLPYDYVHPPQTGPLNEKQQGAVEMITSQDEAKAAALRELGYKVPARLQVANIERGTPASGKLEVRDILLAVDGKPIKAVDTLSNAIAKIGPHPLTLTIERDQRRMKVRITPEMQQGTPRIGIVQGIGYEFPFEIQLHVDPSVGGPSAGLMFSLAIYDTLTPGALTGGAIVAGTGELAPNGAVGPIGGIAQKIAAADAAHAKLFFVPKGNCPDVAGLHPDGMRLVEATSVHEARTTLQKWASNHDAALPTC